MRILHLSDIHFALMHHAFRTNGKPHPTRLADVIVKGGGPPPDIIVVSGDIGWEGKREDYDLALAFFGQLKQHFNGAEIVIAPGNHDVDRNEGVDDEKRQDEFIAFLKAFYGDDTFSKRYPLFSQVDPCLSRRQSLVYHYYDRDLDFRIVSVNSAANIHGWTSCRECYQPKTIKSSSRCGKCKRLRSQTEQSITIDGNVADKIGNLIKDETSDRSLRIFVLHHNLFPFAEHEEFFDSADRSSRPDPTMVANAARLQSWLVNSGFHLVLHGHKHQPQARDDSLYHRDGNNEGQRIVVLGAGSTSVRQSERGSEPLSFYEIDCHRLSNKRFSVKVIPKKIVTGSVVPEIRDDTGGFDSEVGPKPAAAPLVFYAENMADCHNAIYRTVDNGKILTNFISIVDLPDSPQFQMPQHVHLDGQRVSDERLIRASFLALHPEYQEDGGWKNPAEVRNRIRNLRPRFRFSHGPRMFGLDTYEEASSSTLRSPIEEALSKLCKQNDTSHAFIGMFDSKIDKRSQRIPPPALVGVQFSTSEPGRLDMTMIYRKLDLSFWWAVNMYEAIELWTWAVEHVRRERLCQRGRITFFASLAQWKQKGSGATFQTTLDELDLENLVEVILGANLGKPDRLIKILNEKIERTNENNIDAVGIGSLIKVVNGIQAAHGMNEGRLSEEFLKALKDGHKSLTDAEECAWSSEFVSPTIKSKVDEAKERLQNAVSLLK